ncbi:MAG: hypothetical protein NT023_02755, partial [Armatimonadetes bacterium]|nr:hypothetical protein [Armatimonadota bacterium]
MIKITKPDAPAVLLDKGAAQRQADESAYDAGVRNFEAQATIYGHRSVKSALRNAQHKGYSQNEAESLNQPGYYWLAYEWSNLFFTCQICNQTYKKNLFPLSAPSKRATCHRDSLEEEDCLLVDPAKDDPEAHISFRREVIFGASVRGEETINVCGLDRSDLDDRRDTLLDLLQGNHDVVIIAQKYSNDKALQQRARRAQRLLYKAMHS